VKVQNVHTKNITNLNMYSFRIESRNVYGKTNQNISFYLFYDMI